MDNYAEFLERLKKAAASLKKRQARLNHVLRAVDSAAEQNWFGFNEWTKRNSRLEALLAGEDAGKPRALKDLHAISANMVNVFRGRSERVNASTLA